MHPCRIFLHSYDISFALLSKSTSYFGNNPRRCFEASVSVKALGWKKKNLESDIERVAGAGSGFIRGMINQMPYPVDAFNLSHSIFQILPTDGDPSLSSCKFDAVSRWALDNFMGKFDKHNAEARTSFYNVVSSSTAGAPLQGRLFEIQVLNYLDGIKGDYEFTLRRLAGSGKIPWLYRGPIPRFSFKKSTLTAGIANAVQKKVPVHLVPISPNQAAVDSILYDPKEPDTLTCIQITKNKSHPIAVSGLKLIQEQLKRGTPLARLRPSKANPWRFIFIVPSLDMESTFNLQDFNEDTLLHEWASKVQQYVVKLEEHIIFGKEPDRTQLATTSQTREQQVRC